MAVPARLEIVDHEAVLRSGALGDTPYGSLLGGAPRKLKKRPVLVLDAAELAEAHQAIANGGAQIMEEAGDPAHEARQRVPAMMLGLAPIGADEDWQPPIVPLPRAQAREEDALATPVDLPVDPVAAEPAPSPPVAEELPASAPAAPSFSHLLAPQPQAEDDWDSALPSLDEQLARMRDLTQRPASPPPPVVAPAVETAADPAPPHQVSPPPEPEPLPEPAPAVVSAPRPEPAPTQQPEPVEPVAAQPSSPPPSDAGDDFLDLSAHVELPAQVAPGPEREAFDDGPDLSWMMPKERRELHIGDGSQSSLRARLVQAQPEPEPELPPSLWDRLRDWWRGLFG